VVHVNRLRTRGLQLLLLHQPDHTLATHVFFLLEQVAVIRGLP
jgi:hypothetical protein